MSVNGSDFVKYSTHSISAPSSQSNLPPNYFWLFPSWKAIVMHAKKPDDLQSVLCPVKYTVQI
ncbi:hypothetical protein GKD07_14335 [Lactobacillus rhamnosus]|nr:hypothetical protein [Lacticaseibacillus rhamnosus]